MPFANAADIALGTRAQQVEKVETPAIKARYPNSARDDIDNTPQGYFDLVVDAQTVLAARQSLQGVERRRFAVEVDGLIWFDSIVFAGVVLVDPDLNVNVTCLVSRWQIDCENERTTFELLG